MNRNSYYLELNSTEHNFMQSAQKHLINQYRLTGRIHAKKKKELSTLLRQKVGIWGK